MIVAPKIARAIADGRITEMWLPTYGRSTSPWQLGDRIAIQPGATKPARCTIVVAAVAKKMLYDADERQVKAAGFTTRTDFMAAFCDRFGGDYVNDLAFIVRFHRDLQAPARLLHRRSERGYTTEPHEAMRHEPEAVAIVDLDPAWLTGAVERHGRARLENPEEVQRLARITANRVRERLIAQSRAGLDIRPLISEIEALLQ